MPEVKPSHLRFYNLCFACCFTIALLLAIELGATVILRFFNVGRSSGIDHRELEVYKKEPWAQQYWMEEGVSSVFSYESYVGWKRLPYTGQMVAVDASQNRKTNDSDCSQDHYTVWMFGGSTMWGTGAPDWGTIPSQLAKLFSQSGGPVCVVNYGQTGWRNTQEVIEMMLELKRAPRKPDLVLFYDGFNDGYAFYQSGKFDVHMNYDQIRDQLENPSHRSFWGSLASFLRQTHSVRLITAAQVPKTFLDGGAVAPHFKEADAKQDLEISYLRNLDIVGALSKQYGFEYAFFWQPAIFAGRKHLSPEEERLRQHYSSRIEETDIEYREMANLLKVGSPAHFFDISDAFDKEPDTIFVDFVHVVPKGNELVAGRVYETLQRAGWLRDDGSHTVPRPH